MAYEDYKAFTKDCVERGKTIDKEIKQITRLYEEARDIGDELTDVFRKEMIVHKGRVKHFQDLTAEALGLCDEIIALETEIAKCEKAGDPDKQSTLEGKRAVLVGKYEKLMSRRARLLKEIESADVKAAHDRAKSAIKIAKQHAVG